MNNVAHLMSRLKWTDRLALFTAAPIFAGMLLLFALTVIASGGLGIGRYAMYFGVLTLEVEALVAGSVWVVASLLHHMLSSVRAGNRARRSRRAKPTPIGALRA